jgi:hypothetical protein
MRLAVRLFLLRASNMSYNSSSMFVAGRHLIASVKGCKPVPTPVVPGGAHEKERLKLFHAA